MPNVPVVAFDEAGNTGQDLLNSSQSVFVLVSIYLEESIAQKLISECLTPQMHEAHFKKLKRSTKGKQNLLSFYHSEHINLDRIVVNVMHKKFMTVTKIVDLLIEDMLFRFNHNLYEKGEALALANLLYYTIPAFFDESIFNDFLNRFIKMVRELNDKNVYDFYKNIDRMLKTAGGKKITRELKLIRDTKEYVFSALNKYDKIALEPAVPAFFLHAPVWGNILDEKYIVLHDNSKSLAQNIEYIKLISAEKGIHKTIKYGSNISEYPLKIANFQMVDSKDYTQIQVADLIASGMFTWIRGKMYEIERDSFWEALNDSILTKMKIHPLWPSGPNFVDDIIKMHSDSFETNDPATAMAEFIYEQSIR